MGDISMSICYALTGKSMNFMFLPH
jgi:hypothetical protein